MNQLVPQQQNSSVPPGINPKTRKPYTISKQRENWTDEEHQKFLEALTLFDRDWKKIESFVGTKTVIQIRSHAQKYFIKVQKNNTGERIPPPRPKRKSVQPYPQKQKHDSMGGFNPEAIGANQFISSSSFANWMSFRGLMPNVSDAQVNPSDVQRQLEQLQQAQQYIQQAMINAQNSTRNNGVITPILSPNFPRIYAFLSNLFENNSSSFSEALAELSPIDRETMQILMHNLAINLANQQHRETHQSLSEQYRMKKDEDEELNQINGISSPRGPITSANTTPPLSSSMNVSGDFYPGDGEFDQANTAHLNAAAAATYHFNTPNNNQHNINSLYTLQNHQNSMSHGLNMTNMNLNINNMALNGLNGLGSLNNNLNGPKSYF